MVGLEQLLRETGQRSTLFQARCFHRQPRTEDVLVTAGHYQDAVVKGSERSEKPSTRPYIILSSQPVF